MSNKIVSVGSLAVHFDITCHWFLGRFEATSGLTVVFLVLHGILGDGTWWKGLVQNVV